MHLIYLAVVVMSAWLLQIRLELHIFLLGKGCGEHVNKTLAALLDSSGMEKARIISRVMLKDRIEVYKKLPDHLYCLQLIYFLGEGE